MSDIEDLQIELENTLEEIDRLDAEVKRIDNALSIILQYGGIDGDHHKAWVLDQVIHKLTGDKYDDWVKKYNSGEDGPNTYEWNEGIPP